MLQLINSISVTVKMEMILNINCFARFCDHVLEPSPHKVRPAGIHGRHDHMLAAGPRARDQRRQRGLAAALQAGDGEHRRGGRQCARGVERGLDKRGIEAGQGRHVRQHTATMGSPSPHCRKAMTDQNPYAEALSTFAGLFDEAKNSAEFEPNAMSLATASTDGRPSVRAVLLKAFDERGFVFYTHVDSRKGHELDANPRAALLFLWRSLREAGVGVGDREIDADDRSDPCSQAGLGEPDRPVEAVAVGERQGVHVVSGSGADQHAGVAGAVLQRVPGGDPQVRERLSHAHPP